MSDILDLGDGQSPILSLLQQAVFEVDLLKKLNATDILISALDKDMLVLTKAKKMKQYIHDQVLSNDIFMRKLELYSRICDNPETAIEYHGLDFVTHPEFNFDQEFKHKIAIINKNLNHFIGNLIKEHSRGDEVEL